MSLVDAPIVGAFFARADDLIGYDYFGGTFDLSRQEFRFTAVRPGLGNIDIGPLVTDCEWSDEGTWYSINVIPVLRGNITLTKPDWDQNGADITINDGHRVRCDVKWGGEWKHLWEMRITDPVLSLEDGRWQFQMADDLTLLSLSTDSFRYRAGKTKKVHGWRYDEIVRDVARKYKIPLGGVVKGTHRIKHLAEVTDVSPLECIRRAVEEEANWTGRKYIIGWRWIEKHKKYGMEIRQPRRNPLLYVLADQLQRGSIETIRYGQLATALTAHGSGKVAGSKRRKKYTVHLTPATSSVSKKATQQYGFIHKTITIPGQIDSHGELLDKAKKHMARYLKPTYRVTLTHTGIAYVRRGDAVRINLPEHGLSHKVMFVVSVTHSVSSGVYTMELELVFRDPLDPVLLQKERDAALRAHKRKTKAKK